MQSVTHAIQGQKMYVTNPDGKEIISRDNEVSLLRKTEPDKAYYNCHTDITIPYDEIGNITVVAEDGTRTDKLRMADSCLMVPLHNDAFYQNHKYIIVSCKQALS